MTLNTKLAVFLLALAAGCSTAPPQPAPGTIPPPPVPPDALPSPIPGAPPAAAPGPAAKPKPSGSIAVAQLTQSARADAAAGRLSNAAASLERALRIEPRNARLWNELARVRLQQRDYAQAESVAARSNSWAGDDNALRAANWQLIAQARDARGDSPGARAALENARRLAP